MRLGLLLIILFFIPIILTAQNNDCSSAVVLCTTGAVSFNPIGPGFNDFQNGNNNDGCLSGEHSSAWYYFEVAPNSPPNANLAFTINPDQPSGEDYDFALFGPDVACGNLGSPIRCSYADDNVAGPLTGMNPAYSDQSEGAFGDGFVQDLIVQPGQGFYLLVDNFNNSGNGFTMSFTGSAIFDCTAEPPCVFITNAGADVTRCQGLGPFNLSGSATGATGTIIYAWTPTTYLNNPAIANPTVTPPAGFTGTITYVLTATANNCTDDDTVVVTINPQPVASITPAGPFCTGSGSHQLSASPPGGTWSGTGVNSSGLFNPPSQGTYTVNYSVTVGGCTGSTSIQIQVNNPPNASISPAGPFCETANLYQMLGSPSGGVWGGDVGPTGIFDPVAEGPGNHIITYTATSNGCTSTATTTVVVNPSPIVSVNSPGNLCTSSGIITLTGNPGGGVFSGTGITAGGQVNTGTIGVGPHTITYTVSQNGCPGTAMLTFTVNGPPTVSITSVPPLCVNSNPVQLIGSPSGGSWSGTGVFNSGIFDPVIGQGTYIASYTVTAANGCIGTATTSIVVNGLPNVNIQDPGPICIDTDPFMLLGTPSGGTWSGGPSPNGTINPQTLGIGNHTVNYTYTSAAGCTNFTSLVLHVVNLPNVNINQPGPYCIGQGSQQLTATPSGGTWGGSAPPGGLINPTNLGPGNYTVTYVYTDANGCSASDTATFAVSGELTVTANPAGPFCLTDPVQQLSGTPSGGQWIGTGVTANGQFNPAVGQGTYNLTYTYSNAQGCYGSDDINIQVNTLPVVNITNPGPLCSNGSVVTLTATPAGGVWSGAANASGQVNPSTLSVGPHAVTYTYSTPSGCSGSGTINIIIVNPSVVTITPAGPFCAGQGIQTLSGNPSGGTWGGAANAAGQFNPITPGNYVVNYTATDASGCTNSTTATIVVTTGPTVNITPAGPFCLNAPVQNLSATPAGGTWSGAVSSSGQFDPTVAGVGPHVLTYTVAVSGCTGTGTGTVTVLPLPTATISGSGSVCPGGGSVNLSISATGTPPFQVVYAIDNAPQSAITIPSLSPYTLNVTLPGSYTIVSVTDANSCAGTGSGTSTIGVYGSPIVNNIATNCNPTGTAYVLTFEITGGDPTSYAVTGGGGSISASAPYIFTSTSIPSGSGYNFNVTDAHNCAPVTVQDNIVVCNCLTAVGTMNPNPISQCGPNCVTAVYINNGEHLDGDDIREFVLHTNSGTSLGTIIQRGPNPTFCFNAATMSYETTYYISAIVGNDMGNMMVNTNDPCLAVAQGTPVVFHVVPTAILGTSGAICSGSSYNLSIALTGNAPWTVSYSDGANTYTLNNISTSPYQLMVSPSATTSYSLTSVADNFCTGTTSGSATVTVHNAPVTSNIATTCNNTNTAYVLTFQISGGDPPSYLVNGVTGSISSSMPYIFTSTAIPSGQGYLLTVNDVNNCAPVQLQDPQVVCNCSTAVGTMSNSALSLCGSDCSTATLYNNNGQNLDGDDLVEFVLHTGSGASLGTILARNNTSVFCFDATILNYETTYYVSAIAGSNDGSGHVNTNDPCLQVAQGTPIQFHNIPDASLSPDVSICQSTSTDITVNCTGVGPFVVQINNGSSINSLNISNSPYLYTVTPGSTTTYTLVSVADTYCQNTPNDHTTVTTHGSPAVNGLTTLCNSTNTAYTLSFQISGGDPASYTVTGVNGNITGSNPATFTSALIPSGSGYAVVVDDAFHCNPISLNDPIVLCNCTTFAGTMSSLAEVTACEDDIVTVGQDGNENLDGDDVLQYVLHDGSSNTLGNIYATNSNPSFGFVNGLQYYTTYYISAVAGSNDGNGLVLLTDPCLSVAQGTPVRFLPLPTGNLLGDTTICINNPTRLTFVLPAIGLYDVSYSDGTSTYLLSGIANGYQMDVSPISNTQYMLLTIAHTELPSCDYIVPASAFGVIATVNVIVSPPNAVNLTKTCNGTGTAYVVNFEIVDGDPATWSVTGGTGSINGNMFSSIEIPSGTPFDYILDDGNGCQPHHVTGNFVCNCITGIGTLSPNGQVFCENTPATATYDNTGQMLDANDVMQFVLHDGTSVPIGNIIATSNTPSFAFNQATMDYNITYYIAGLIGNNNGSGAVSLLDPCLAVTQNVPVQFHHLSTATLTGATTLCEGQSANLNFGFNGYGPYNVVYTDGTDNVTLNNIVNNHQENVAPGGTTTFSLVTVDDLGNPGCVNLQPAAVTLTVNPLVNAGTANAALAFCEGVGGVVSLAGQLNGADAGGSWTETSANPAGAAFNAGAGTLAASNLNPGAYSFRYTVDGLPPCPDDQETVNIVINENPVAVAGADAVLSCVDTIVTIGGAGSSSGTEIAYHWTASDGGAVADSTSLHPNVTQGGTYSLMVTNTLTGCFANDVVLVDPGTGPPVSDYIIKPVTCYGESNAAIILDNVTGGTPPYLYSLNGEPFASTSYYTQLPAGSYDLTVQDSKGCEWSTSVSIEDPPLLTLYLGLDTVIRFGDSIRLFADVQPLGQVDTMYWSRPDLLVFDNTVYDPYILPLNGIGLTATVIDTNGCTATDNLNIFVEKPRNVFVPNVFFPDSETGINNVFTVFGDKDVVKIKYIRVFDRWGEMVYERQDFLPNDITSGWDGMHRGKRVNPQVFVWYAEIEFSDGLVKLYTGDVTVDR